MDHIRLYKEFLSLFKKSGKPPKPFREALSIIFVVLKYKLKKNL